VYICMLTYLIYTHKREESLLSPYFCDLRSKNKIFFKAVKGKFAVLIFQFLLSGSVQFLNLALLMFIIFNFSVTLSICPAST
jgi:hypothetical protein